MRPDTARLFAQPNPAECSFKRPTFYLKSKQASDRIRAPSPLADSGHPLREHERHGCAIGQRPNRTPALHFECSICWLPIAIVQGCCLLSQNPKWAYRPALVFEAMAHEDTNRAPWHMNRSCPQLHAASWFVVRRTGNVERIGYDRVAERLAAPSPSPIEQTRY